ncbi:MAG: hypothetical protein JNK87_35620 [Bryobacterales bacterium]|nr:hypothetical protein [Bryobacterales bacterium]
MQPTPQRLLTRLAAALLPTLLLAAPYAAAQVLPGPISLIPVTKPPTVTVDPVSGTAVTIPASTLDQMLSPIAPARLRPPAGRVVPVGIYDGDRLLADGSTVWVLDRKRNQVTRLDSQTGMVLTAIVPPVSAGTCKIADFLLDGADSLWIGCDTKLFRIRIATRTVERAVDLWGAGVFRLAFVGDKVVILGHSSGYFAGMLRVYSPDTGTMEYIWLYAYSDLWNSPYGLTLSPSSYHYGHLIDMEVVAPDQVVITLASGLTLLFRITNAPNFVATLADPRTDGWVDTAFLDGVLWTLNRTTGQLHRMVVATRQTLSPLTIGPGAKKLLHTGRVLWVMLPDRLVAVNPFTNSKMGETAVGQTLLDFAFSGAEVISLDQNAMLRRQ